MWFSESSKKRLFSCIHYPFFLFQNTANKEQQQQAIDELQNADVSAMQLHYKTVSGDKMTDISDDFDQQSDQRDGSSNTLHHDNIDTVETVDRKPASSRVSRQLCNNDSETCLVVCVVERVQEVQFTDEQF